MLAEVLVDGRVWESQGLVRARSGTEWLPGWIVFDAQLSELRRILILVGLLTLSAAAASSTWSEAGL